MPSLSALVNSHRTRAYHVRPTPNPTNGLRPRYLTFPGRYISVNTLPSTRRILDQPALASIPGYIEDTWNPPPGLLDDISAIIRQGWAPRTRTAHDSAVKRYVQFCTDVGVPTHEVFPAPERVLVAFAASMAGSVAGTTARNLIAGIKAFHIARNLPWHGSARLRIIIDAVERLRPATSQLPPRPPVTLEMLRKLVESMPEILSHFDRAVLTVALVAFWGQFRIGELLPTSANAYSPDYHPSVASWILQGTAQSITALKVIPLTRILT
jgi:hypothetical protein